VPAPRRLATVEHGPWVALATTWAAGVTEALWTDASIAAVANACHRTGAHTAPGTLPPVGARRSDFDGWVRVLEIGACDGREAGNAAPAAEVVSGWEGWTAGDALVHRDIRLDNAAVDAEERSAVLLDWTYTASSFAGRASTINGGAPAAPERRGLDPVLARR
jgi:aminoglycoside phosphotransferase (APT) family kinase protein